MTPEWWSGVATGVLVYAFTESLILPWLAHKLATLRRAHGS